RRRAGRTSYSRPVFPPGPGASGRGSQHRGAGGQGHGWSSRMTGVPLTAVTGGGVVPLVWARSDPARAAGMASRSASSPGVFMKKNFTNDAELTEAYQARIKSTFSAD